MNAQKKLTKARTVLVMNHPFWASLALRLPFVACGDGECSTGYTDGTKIAYNPKFIQELTEPEVVSFIAHEVCHPSMLHHLREGSRDHQRWNSACDYAVNEILKQSGFEIPADWLLDEEKYKGMSAETIYPLLPEKPPKGWAGGCGPGEVREFPGKGGGEPSQSEIREQEAAWKTAISQAAQIAKARDELPEGLERFVKEILDPKIDWRVVLASYLTETIDGDYSWREPNRRYAASGVFLPSIASEPTGDILLFIDTSGSIGEEDMQSLASEAQAVMSAYEVEMDVVYVDAEFQGRQRFTTRDIPIKLEPKGGGGTDYRPGFVWAGEKNLMPACAVYLTDGWCGSFPENPPPYPVLWVLGGNYPADRFSPPFGEVLRMK